MKCPHCEGSVSIFSRELNRFKKSKSCPHCDNPVRLTVNFGKAALLFVPAVALALVLDSAFESAGVGGSWVTAAVTGGYVLLIFGLKAE